MHRGKKLLTYLLTARDAHSAIVMCNLQSGFMGVEETVTVTPPDCMAGFIGDTFH